jgi:hypothetical protein
MEKEHRHGEFAEGQEGSEEHEHEEGSFAEGQAKEHHPQEGKHCDFAEGQEGRRSTSTRKGPSPKVRRRRTTEGRSGSAVRGWRA